MLNKERQIEILKIIKGSEAVSVKSLVKSLYASEATIRRDLNELEKDGQIKRIYGGAMLAVDSDKQIPLYAREKEFHEEKRIVCENAVKIVKDGSVIFLDGSSTSQIFVRYLYKFKDLIVITNGLKIAQALGEMHVKTFCTGGRLIDNSYVFAGSDAENFVKKYNADLCFLSCKGMDEHGKFTDTSESETELRKRFLENSKTRAILLTSNKIGKTYLHTLCNSTDVDYIFCDQPIDGTIEFRKK